MRVLITGAQGFMGRWLSARWLAADPAVTIVGLGRSPRHDRFTTRLSDGRQGALPNELRINDPRYTYLSADLLDRISLTRVIQTTAPEVIVHLAAVLRGDDSTQTLRTNVEGTAALLEAIVGSGCRPRVLLGSSAAVYGRPQRLPIDEDHPCLPLTAYGASKLAAEHLARIFADQHGLPLVVARIFNPLGPGVDGRHVTARIAEQAAQGAGIELGATHPTRDFHDVRDAVDALRLLATRGEPGVTYNVASGAETAVRDLLATAMRVLGRPVELSDSGAERPDEIDRHVADIGRLRALGFEPRFTAADALRDQISWCREALAAPIAEATAPLRVEVRDIRSYPIEIAAGLLASVPARLRARFPNAKMVLLTDTNVNTLYGERFVAGLKAESIEFERVILPAGERSKQLDECLKVIDRMHRFGFERRSVLICLGGGLVSDVGGFIASTYMRGVPYVNVPTTLLAQHDAGVGGKVAVNMPWAKNFIGMFHHPQGVYCDPEVLRTLDARNLSGGVAEAIKVALTGDRTLFEHLETKVAGISAGTDVNALATVVRRAAQRKIALLDPDPYELDLRRVLNLGHTLAHPLETELAYAGLLHGEAVGYGLALATKVAERRGLCPPAAAKRIHALLAAYALPPAIAREHQISALNHLRAIRMVRGGVLNFVMPTDIDRVVIVPDLELDELRDAIDALDIDGEWVESCA